MEDPSSRLFGRPYHIMATLAFLSTGKRFFPQLLSLLFVLLLAGALCYLPLVHPLPFRDASDKEGGRPRQMMARSILIIALLTLTYLSLRRTYDAFVRRVQGLLDEEEEEEEGAETGEVGSKTAAGDATVIHVLPQHPSPPAAQGRQHRRKLSVAPSPVVAAAVASVRQQMKQGAVPSKPPSKPATKLKITRPRSRSRPFNGVSAPSTSSASLPPVPAAAILTTPPQFLRSAVWASSGKPAAAATASSPFLRAPDSSSLAGAASLGLPSPLSLSPALPPASAFAFPFPAPTATGPSYYDLETSPPAAAAAAAESEAAGEGEGHTVQYPPRGVLLRRSELAGIVRKWLVVQALMTLAVPAAHLALSWPGVKDSSESQLHIALITLFCFIVFGAWTVWFISLDALSHAAQKLYDTFRRPHTMTKGPDGKVDFPSYLDWFMHIRRELRRTSEDMRHFVLFGIGGCMSLAVLLAIWGLEDTSAVWEGVVFLVFALLLLASAARVTSRFQAVLPGLVSSLSVTPELNPEVHRALAAMLAAEGTFSFSPELHGADGEGNGGGGGERDLKPEHHIDQAMAVIAAQQQLTAAAQQYSSVITFLLQTSGASDAFTYYRIVLSSSLVVRVLTLGFSVVALLLRNPA